jgi:hypothetical protein
MALDVYFQSILIMKILDNYIILKKYYKLKIIFYLFYKIFFFN